MSFPRQKVINANFYKLQSVSILAICSLSELFKVTLKMVTYLIKINLLKKQAKNAKRGVFEGEGDDCKVTCNSLSQQHTR